MDEPKTLPPDRPMDREPENARPLNLFHRCLLPGLRTIGASLASVGGAFFFWGGVNQK